MKDENRRHALAPFLTSSAILAAALIALRYFYGKTFFVPFRMLAIVLALPLCLSWLAVSHGAAPAPRKAAAKGNRRPGAGHIAGARRTGSSGRAKAPAKVARAGFPAVVSCPAGGGDRL